MHPVSPRQFLKIKTLFSQACRLPPADRKPFLDQACGGDRELERCLQEMLAEDAAIDDGNGTAGLRVDLEQLWADAQPAVDQVSDFDVPAEPLPERVGPFRVIRKIGEGGMGVVLEAQQDHPQRTVAVKLLRSAVADSAMMRRFGDEINLLARLEHPGIARIYEAGSATIGGATQPYFTMELVRGAPLIEFAVHSSLTQPGKLELFARVCDAVAHAHQHGIIHRDLKPANILIDASIEGGQPKVLDFGVGRALTSPVHTMTARTEASQIIGTLQYMSPEQAFGDTSKIDPRSDVYALGVILFQILTGELPYDLADRSIPDAIDQIRLNEPRRIGAHHSDFRGDLETIVGMALEKDKERRYASAGELAADVRRFLSHLPIVARPPSAIYRVRKFARRNRAFLVGLSATTLTLLLGTIGIAYFFRQSDEHARLAAEAERGTRWIAYKSAILGAKEALQRDDIPTAEQVLTGAPTEHRAWEWNYLRRRSKPWETELISPSATIKHTCLDEARGQVLGVLDDQSVGVWDASNGQWLGAHPTGLSEIDCISPATDNDLVALGTHSGEVFLWDRFTGDMRPIFRSGGQVWWVEFRREGSRLFVGCFGEIILLDARSGEIIARNRIGEANSAVRSDADLVAFASAEQTLLWNPLTGEERRLFATRERPNVYAFSPDGKYLAVGTRYRNIYMLEVETGAQVHVLTGHEKAVFGVGFSPDGKRLWSTSEDESVRVWDLENGKQLREYHDGNCDRVHWIAEGRALLIGRFRDAFMRVYPVDHAATAVLGGHPSYVYSVACSPDGSRLAAGMAGWGGIDKVFIWRIDVSTPFVERDFPMNSWTGLAFARDGMTLYAGSHSFRLSDATSGAAAMASNYDRNQLANLFGPRISKQMAFSTDGTLRAVAGSKTALYKRDLGRASTKPLSAGDDEPTVTLPITTPSLAVAIHPNGQRLATAHEDGGIRIWDIQRLPRVEEIGVLRAHTGIVYCVDYSPDGTRLASGGNDNVIYIWDADRGEALLELRGHSAYVHDLVFSPDGSRLFSGSGDKTVRIWDAGK